MDSGKKAVLFCIGGCLYGVSETLYRGRTHWSMVLLGGGCFLALGQLRKRRIPLPLLPIAGSALITAAELATGLLINRNYHVWDYRQMPLNVLGQICLPFSLLWMPVSLAAMQIYERLERRL